MNIIGRRRLYYLISLAVIIPGLVSLIFPPHLKLGVDFTGGTLWELQFPGIVQPGDVKTVLAQFGYPDSVVQTSGERGVLIRTKEIPSEGSTKSDISNALKERLGQPTELRFE